MSDSEGAKNHQVSYPVLPHVHGVSTEGIEELPLQGGGEGNSFETVSEQQRGLVKMENDEPREIPTPLVMSYPPGYQSQLPNRYLKRTYTDPYQIDEQEEHRLKAKEIRRARKTFIEKQLQQSQELRLQQMEELQQLPKQKETGVGSDSDDSSVDENYDVASLAESVGKIESGWRGRMQAVLKSPLFHLVIVILVAVDALIVLFELFLDFGAFRNRLCNGDNLGEQAQFCHYQLPMTCAPNSRMILERINITASPGNGTENLCHCGFRDGLYVCLKANEVSGVNPVFVLHLVSISILSLFLVEIVLKMIAFRLKHFTENFEVFDAIVIVLSWTLDVASIIEEDAFAAVGLLIVLRLWRSIRIAHGCADINKDIKSLPTCCSFRTTYKGLYSDSHLSEARAEARKIVHAFHKAQDRMDQFEDENIKLKRELAKYKAATTTKPYLRLRSSDDEECDHGIRLNTQA